MKLVIDIDEDIYKSVVNNDDYVLEEDVDWILFENAIANGTPLPKHHGRLIDADELKRTMENDPRKALSFVDLTDFIWLAPTIIEADKEYKER